MIESLARHFCAVIVLALSKLHTVEANQLSTINYQHARSPKNPGAGSVILAPSLAADSGLDIFRVLFTHGFTPLNAISSTT